LRQEEPVIVQAFSYAWYYAIVAAIFAKVPHVLVGERNVILWTKWWHILMDRVLLWKATYAIVNAKAIRHQMITDQHMPINRVRIIYNGLDLRRFDQISGWGFSGLSMNPALANAGHLVVCAVASLSVRKRIDLLLRAHALVLAEVPNVDLWLIGDGPLRSQLESLTQELEIRHSVTFWGIRHDVPAILKHATVGALSSQVEGLSNAIMEYMAARLPVVATNVGGNLELVLHGETGLLVPPNDPQALADAIVYLLRNPEGARRFGEAGRRRVEEHFTVERMVRETEAVYEELLSQNGH
jgi:glycosyltransferase involved in cell wall biosynthesis